jgi:hypothetical protein
MSLDLWLDLNREGNIAQPRFALAIRPQHKKPLFRPGSAMKSISALETYAVLDSNNGMISVIISIRNGMNSPKGLVDSIKYRYLLLIIENREKQTHYCYIGT